MSSDTFIDTSNTETCTFVMNVDSASLVLRKIWNHCFIFVYPVLVHDVITIFVIDFNQLIIFNAFDYQLSLKATTSLIVRYSFKHVSSLHVELFFDICFNLPPLISLKRAISDSEIYFERAMVTHIFCSVDDFSIV